jgi:hypothetical protein
MEIKDDSVRLTGMRPELLFAMMVANEVYAGHNEILVITSVNDGRHSLTSLHYAGCAFDCRTRCFPSHEYATAVALEIKRRLGLDFDVLFEGDHIHVEYQPRRR